MGKTQLQNSENDRDLINSPLLFIAYYSDVIMGTMASQITNLTNVYSIVYSGADQRNIKVQSQ